MRAKIVFEASRTEGIAISVAPEGLKDMIGVSARSKGKVNVQVVMESLGGGGHRTVAGAQLQGMTIEEAKAAILDKALEALHSAEKEEEQQ